MVPLDQSRMIAHTARDTTQQPLPDIIVAKYHTQRVSTSSYYFEGQHLPWTDFENQVRKNFERQNWGTSIIAVRRTIPDQFDIVNEMFHCGDELSLSGRFVQQVLHVMTAVGRDLKIPVRFGDFKTVYNVDREKQRLKEENRRIKEEEKGEGKGKGKGTVLAQLPAPLPQSSEHTESEEKRKDPDYAAVNDSDRVKFVGEIKTPWTQDFEKNRKHDTRWRKWIAQIAQYMKVYHLRYGFWTNYTETVFLKQEQDSDGAWVLRVSNIIKFSTRSDLTRRADDHLVGCVSLRECMLFLICQTNGPDSAVYVNNEDKGFITDEKDKSGKSGVNVASKTRGRLDDAGDGSTEQKEARKKSELEKQSRSRAERAANRDKRTLGSGPRLDTLTETSRERPPHRLSPPSETTRLGKQDSSDSSRTSSASSQRRMQRTKGHEEPMSRSEGAERSTSKKAMPSAEAQGKQRSTFTSASPERRAQGGATSAADGQEPPPSRSTLSHGRGGLRAQQRPGFDELYDVSDEDRDRTATIPIRASRYAPPSSHCVPSPPQNQSSAAARATQEPIQSLAAPERPSRTPVGSASTGEGGQRLPLREVRTKGHGKDEKESDDKKKKKGKKEKK